MTRIELGQKLSAIRKEKKISKNSIVLKHGIRMDQINGIESGKLNCTLNVLLKYLEGIGYFKNS